MLISQWFYGTVNRKLMHREVARTCVLLGLAMAAWRPAMVRAEAQTPRSSLRAADPTVHWPQFRGPGARGVAVATAMPTNWDASSMYHIRWKTPIPGLGHSSPIIWGDRLFVTSCISGRKNPQLIVGLYGNIAPVEDDTRHAWKIFCMDKKSGKILWEQTAHTGVPAIKRHPKSTHANSTPVTDGKHVVALFGSEGLYCYDMHGKLLWKKTLGVLDAGYWKIPEAQWGFGSSPILYHDMVIVQCDVQRKPFLAAFEVSTGKQIWRTPRDEVCTWSTPTIHESPNRVELIVNGHRHIGGYDPLTGKELWRMTGGTDIPVPTPFVANGLIFITNSHSDPRPLYAIRIGAVGDISLTAGKRANQYVAWSRFGRGTYMQTPIVYGDYLFTCNDNGVFSGYEAKTGKEMFRRRIGGGGSGFTASAVAADGKLYYPSEDGDVYVFTADAHAESLGVNSMNEVCMATPAISEGKLFIRGSRHVFCIGK